MKSVAKTSRGRKPREDRESVASRTLTLRLTEAEHAKLAGLVEIRRAAVAAVAGPVLAAQVSAGELIRHVLFTAGPPTAGAPGVERPESKADPSNVKAAHKTAKLAKVP